MKAILSIVQTQMQSLLDLLRLTKETWKVWIQQENKRNGKNMVPWTDSDYVDVISRPIIGKDHLIGDDILRITLLVLHVLQNKSGTQTDFLNAKKDLIAASATVAMKSRHARRFAGIYHEIEECITSLCDLTGTKRDFFVSKKRVVPTDPTLLCDDCVNLLAAFETYPRDTTSDLEYATKEIVWGRFKKRYKVLKEELRDHNSTSIELKQWRFKFRKLNDSWTKHMGNYQYIADKEGLDKEVYKTANDPLNKLRQLVQKNTQQCDEQAMKIETIRRNQETAADVALKAAGVLPQRSHTLLVMRACLERREPLF
jgi:hypothetical protein